MRFDSSSVSMVEAEFIEKVKSGYVGKWIGVKNGRLWLSQKLMKASIRYFGRRV